MLLTLEIVFVTWPLQLEVVSSKLRFKSCLQGNAPKCSMGVSLKKRVTFLLSGLLQGNRSGLFSGVFPVRHTFHPLGLAPSPDRLAEESPAPGHCPGSSRPLKSDNVALRPVFFPIINAGHRHCLRRGPVIGRELKCGGIGHPFQRSAAPQGNYNVAHRF